MILGEFLLQPWMICPGHGFAIPPSLTWENKIWRICAMDAERVPVGGIDFRRPTKATFYGEAFQWLKKVMTQQDYLSPF